MRISKVVRRFSYISVFFGTVSSEEVFIFVKRFSYISMLLGIVSSEEVFIFWLINRRDGHFNAFMLDIVDLNCLTASNDIWGSAKLLEGLAIYLSSSRQFPQRKYLFVITRFSYISMLFGTVSSEEVFICWFINMRHGYFNAFILDMVDPNYLTASNDIC